MKIEDGLVQYSDGLWGVSLSIPEKMSSTGKRTRFQKKIGSKTLAKIERDKILLGWRQGKPSHLTGKFKKTTCIKDLSKIWIESRSKKSLKKNKSLKNQIDKVFGKMSIQNLKKRHLIKYISTLRDEGFAESTIRNRIACLRGCVKIALDEGYIDENPFKNLSPKFSIKESLRHNFITKDQEAKLLRELGEYANFARFAILTGMRQGEQLSMTWDRVDFSQKYVHLKHTKTSRQRYVPLSKEAVDILKDQKKKANATIFCFPSPTGKKWGTNNFRQRVWRPAFNRAGLKKMRWHDLRHTCASRLIQAGVSVFWAKEVLGHACISTTQGYAHLSQSHLLEAVEKIE